MKLSERIAADGVTLTAGLVMNCLIAYAVGYENSPGYAEWADEYGIDPDDKRHKADYRLIGAQTAKLRAFLGAKYDAYLRDTENDILEHVADLIRQGFTSGQLIPDPAENERE